MPKILSRIVLTAIALGVCSPVRADVLTFAGNICSNAANGSGPVVACASNGAFINQAYGDTAVVNLSYLVVGPNGNQTMTTWLDPNVYSNLTGVGYGFFGATYASITFNPIAGQTVTLNSLQLGTAPPNVTRSSTVTVIDLATSTTVFTTNVNVGATAALVSPGVSSATGLELRYSPDTFNVAIDNVNFDVAPTGSGSPVPEPSSAGLLAVGALLLLRLRKR